MKRLILLSILSLPFWALGQNTPKKPLPEFTYITPQMNKSQLDSLIGELRKHELTLSYDSLVYDDHKKIKAISGSLDTKSESFPLNTADFKGITIISRGDSIVVIMGLLPNPKK